jgi:fatty acid-binding protein DegV
LNVKPILTIRDGEVVPLKRVRGNQKAFAEFRELFESTSTDSPHLKIGIAHAAAPERLEALRDLVEHVRPNARIEIATQLGAVIGTHAGPGTVGFFWFEDPVD